MLKIDNLIEEINDNIEYWQKRIKRAKDSEYINYYSVRIKWYSNIIEALKEAKQVNILKKENSTLKQQLKALERKYKDLYDAHAEIIKKYEGVK